MNLLESDKLWLGELSEAFGWRLIGAEEVQRPGFLVEEAKRNAGIVLNNRGGVIKQEFPSDRERILVQQEGRVLQKDIRRAERAAEPKEAARRNGYVGEVDAEIVESLGDARL